jgi:protein NEDD1
MSAPTISVSPIPPVPKLPEAFREQEQLTEINIWSSSRTPSPEPHDDDEMVNTPMPVRRRDKGKGKEREVIREKTNVLGLGSPELRKWIESDTEDTDTAPGERYKARKVDFLEVPPNEVQIQSIQVVDSENQDRTGGQIGEPGKATIQMTVQISPRQAPVNVLPNWPPIPSLFSPSRNASQGHGQEGAGSSSAHNPAHELLQSLVRDAMYDFRRETKAEIIGLHLDLVRMGRGWRKELREALDMWGEELKEIRRENELLRQENERLRRGY